MFQRRYSWRRLLCSAGLFALVAADATALLPELPVGPEIQEASMFPWHIIAARKAYDQNGNFIGCLSGGNECIIVYNSLTGNFNVSAEGIHAQP